MSAVFKLVSAEQLLEYSLLADRKTVGPVRNLYFEEGSFALRYLVVDGECLEKPRRLLISPEAIDRIDTDRKTASLSSSLKRIEESPIVKAELPLERQYELILRQYYEWAPYWKMVGAPAPPYLSIEKPAQPGDEADLATSLHSAVAIIGSEVDAPSGSIGTLADFLVDVGVWRIRFLEVALTRLNGDRHILIPTAQIGPINWPNKTVAVTSHDATLKAAPPYRPGSLLSKKEAQKIFSHFGLEPD